MIHMYYGSDVIAARAKALTVLGESDTTIERVEAESYTSPALLQVAESVSLFGDVNSYLIDSPSSNIELWNDVIRAIETLQASPSLFVIVDGALLAAQVKAINPYAARSELFTKGAQVSFNVFALAETLGQRDKKNLWILLSAAQRHGLSAEEIIGTLWWQLKSMRLAEITQSAAEAGMKDYPYNKAKRSLKHYKEGELEQLTESLLTVYHQGHGGERDIWVGLEEWVLGV